MQLKCVRCQNFTILSEASELKEGLFLANKHKQDFSQIGSLGDHAPF